MKTQVTTIRYGLNGRHTSVEREANDNGLFHRYSRYNPTPSSHARLVRIMLHVAKTTGRVYPYSEWVTIRPRTEEF